jgi:uncharacterized repeat protein (TIGR01451 family)
MNRYGVIALLAVALASVVGWKAGVVVGQPAGSEPRVAEVQSPVISAPPEPYYYPPSQGQSQYGAPTAGNEDLPPVPPPSRVPPPGIPPLSDLPPSFAPPSVPPPVAPPSQPMPPLATTRDAEFPVDEGIQGLAGSPAGRQEPAVSLEWIGPPVAKLGQAITYQILVKNISAAAVQQVVVRNKLPAGVSVQGTEPKAVVDGNMLLWDLGTLQPHQERRLDLALVPEAKGDLVCQAMVTFTGTSVVRLKVREPRLVLKCSAPDKVLLGDIATVSMTVSNPGDGVADRVKIKATLPEGLEHTRGKTVELDLGNLGPNENRSVQLVCVTKAGGEQRCEAVATAEGNLHAEDSVGLEVILPRIDLEVNGPKIRYLDRPATYVLKVTNPGSAPASNVTINDLIPAGFKYVSASDGGRHDFSSRTVSWYLGDLTPGQSREVTLNVLAVGTGDHSHKVSAIAARGLKAEAEVTTNVMGLSALLMELVDIDDPVEVGADTSYEVRVTNTGSKMETNLQLICTLPERMEIRGAQGAGGVAHRVQGKDIVFDPLPRLAPRADAIYRIHVRGIAPGDLRFRARITADGLTEPVLKEESTKVYGDESLPR